MRETTGSVRLLHVDDDLAFAEVAAEFIERADDTIAVETATSADEALDVLAERDVDCVVSDYDMPGRDGIEFLEAAREAHPNLPFILFTGKGSEEIASTAISKGVTDYLQKGAGVDRYELLVNRVRNAVDATRSRQKLGKRTRRLETLIDNLPGMVYRCHNEPEWPMEAVEGEVEALTGYSAAALENGDVVWGEEILHPDDRAEMWETVQDALAADDTFEVTYRIVTRDGTTKWMWERGRAVEDGDERMLEGFITDITERKKREETLTALHAAAREIGSADDATTVYETLTETAERVLEFDLVVVDVEHDGSLVQEAWTVEFPSEKGYHRTSLDDDDTMAVRAYNREETIVVDDLRETDVTPANEGLKSVLTVPIGRFGTFQAAATEVAAFDEDDREFAELLADHASAKLAQLADTEELEQKNERLDEFASVLSHDLRNPLNTLELSLEMAARTGDDEHFERCERAVDRMDRLLDDLLTLARYGDQLEERESVELAAAVSEAWDTVETGNASLSVETERTLTAARGRLKQLLENLFRNAVEHGSTSSRTQSDDAVEHGSTSPDSGTRQDAVEHGSTSSRTESDDAVEHGSTSPDSEARQDAGERAGPEVHVTVGDRPDGFYVADDGPGIPADERDTIFETGYSTSDDGTGFGLAIVEMVAREHDWYVSVTDSEDGGARFEISGVDDER